MQVDSFEREELQETIVQLEQALYNHQQWYNLIVRSLICKLPPDKHDLKDGAHKECRFGQWYYGKSSKLLHQHPGFTALGEEHRQMHVLAAKLLLTIEIHTTVHPYDYDKFANCIEHMRLELSALQHELMEMLYNRDALTGAINRVNMLPVLLEQQELVKRKVQTSTIAVIDLDHFKKINEKYGHIAGDCVLAEVSRYIMEHMRPYDKFFRLGGEEFLLCFQNITEEVAFGLVERLRVGIASLTIEVSADDSIAVEASFGITTLDADRGVEIIIANADKALYKAKNQGGNRTEIWSA